MNYHQKEVVTAALAEPIIDGQAPVQVSNHLLRAALTRFTERILEKFVGD